MTFEIPPKAQKKLAEQSAAVTAPEAEAELEPRPGSEADASPTGPTSPDTASSSSETPEDGAAMTPAVPFALCLFCGRDIVSRRTAYQKVEGFERPRRAGGTNAVRLRTLVDVWACDRCVDLKAAGRDGQGELL